MNHIQRKQVSVEDKGRLYCVMSNEKQKSHEHDGSETAVTVHELDN